MTWSPDLITLFQDVKVCIMSSSVLVRFDPVKLAFLKTDWSAEGMVYILIQPSTDESSTKSVKILRDGGACLFDVSKSEQNADTLFN